MIRYNLVPTVLKQATMLALLLCTPVCFAADRILIAPAESWTTAFAGEDLHFSMRLIDPGGQSGVPSGSLRWSHSVNQRTISRGEVKLNGNGDSTAEFVLRTPELRDGVTFATTVTTDFVPEGKTQPVATLQRTLTLFPKNPLADRVKWAQSLDIELFDPAEDTARVFEDLKLPHRRAHRLSVVGHPKQTGILIIGEGTSLVNHRALAENALNAAAEGRRIVMLAPSEGEFSLPGTMDDGQSNGAFPAELRFSGAQVITQLDKRLDAQSWIGKGNTIPSSLLKIQSSRGRVEVHVGDVTPGWPWLEVHFPDTKGVFIMCGFKIIKHWDNGPTPRFLLVRILESLQENPKQ